MLQTTKIAFTTAHTPCRYAPDYLKMEVPVLDVRSIKKIHPRQDGIKNGTAPPC